MKTIVQRIVRAMGVILGLYLILVPIWLYQYSDTIKHLWVQPVLGVLFLTYGLGGYKALSKIMPSQKKHIEHN